MGITSETMLVEFSKINSNKPVKSKEKKELPFCVVCGNPILKPKGRQVTCGPLCSSIRRDEQLSKKSKASKIDKEKE